MCVYVRVPYVSLYCLVFICSSYELMYVYTCHMSYVYCCYYVSKIVQETCRKTTDHFSENVISNKTMSGPSDPYPLGDERGIGNENFQVLR